jgi:hypothetical protein
MADQHPTLSSFPPRPLSMVEIEALEERDRIQSIIEDGFTFEDEEAGLQVSVHSCVIVTSKRVNAAVYVEDDEAWYRVYTVKRPRVDLTEAYEAARTFRGEDTLFASAPLSTREAIHRTEVEKKRFAGDSDYAEGDTFDFPLCDETHKVSRRVDETETEDQFPEDHLYVECSDAESGTLPVY